MKHNLNLRPALVLLALVVISFSCKKSGTEPTPTPPVVPTDTLVGWSKLTVGKQTIGDIFFQNATTGYITGPEMGTFKSVDGGLAWTRIFSGGSNLSVTPDGKVFLVKPTYANLSERYIYRSTDGGKNFDSIYTTAGILQDVFFTGNDTGYVVTSAGSIIRTTNGGATWPDYIGVGISSYAGYSSLFFLNNKSGWITMGERHKSYKMNGVISNWTESSFGITAVASPASIYAPSPNVIYIGNQFGKIYKSIDGGMNYFLLKDFTPNNNLVDLHFLNSSTGYASCGNNIYKTNDGGQNWQTVVTVADGRFVEIHFTDANHGWACGNNGLVLRYNL